MLERIHNLIDGKQQVKWGLVVVILAIATVLGQAFTLAADTQSASRETYNPYAAYAEQYRPVAVEDRVTNRNTYNPYVAYAERYRPAQSSSAETRHQETYNPYAAYAEQYRPATVEGRATNQNTYYRYVPYAERYRQATGLDVQTSAH